LVLSEISKIDLDPKVVTVHMERFSASLLDGRLVFSKYPTEDELTLVVSAGYNYIVNLCTSEEVTWTPYLAPVGVWVLNYHFEDGKKQTPQSGWGSFDSFIQSLVIILKTRKNKLFIHCRGGHARSALIAAIIYALVTKTSADEAIEAVHTAHQARTEMDDKWRRLGAPQREKQRQIIRNYLAGQGCEIVTGRALNVRFFRQQYLPTRAQEIFDVIENEAKWSKPITAGRRTNQTYGDEGLVYKVSFGGYGDRPLKEVERSAQPWTDITILPELKRDVERITGERYNFCVIQRYPTGKVGMKPHRDKEMVSGTTICGLSFGATRKLTLTPPKFFVDQTVREFTLASGSLYLLCPPTNDKWMHSIEPDDTIEPRISLTFRNVPM
jgi:alkylated DNA repair dioxygenase AlkB